MLNIFLESNILIDHFCFAGEHFCSSELIKKIPNSSEFKAWTSDYILSETLGKMKDIYEEKKGLKGALRETIPKSDISKMVQILEDFKRTPNLDTMKAEIDSKAVYEKVRDLCIETKDAPVVLSVLELQEKLRRQVKLVTADMKLFVRAKKNLRTLHPSFHLHKCPSNCKTYYFCKNRDRYTSPF